MTFARVKKFLRTFIREKVLNGDDGPYSVYEVNIHKDSFNEMPVNEHGYVQFTMHRKRTPGEKGDTHYMTLWESRPRQEN